MSSFSFLCAHRGSTCHRHYREDSEFSFVQNLLENLEKEKATSEITAFYAKAVCWKNEI